VEPAPATPDSASEHALTELIRAERVRFALIQSIVPIFFSPIAAAILVLALWSSVDRGRLLIWAAALLVIALVRVALVRSFRASSPSELEVRRWERIFVVSILAVDLWWGIGGLFLLTPSLAEQALVFCFIMLMAGGHTASYSAHPPTVAVGVLALVLPITVRFALMPDTFHRALAFASVMYVLATFRSIKTLSYFFGHTHRLAHELKQEKDRVEELARTDFLTALHNRRAYYELSADALRHAERYGRPAALLMLDIDHFKAINDNFGHATGDVVLRALAALIRQNIRDTDIPGRLGGEEFAVFLPETGREEALAIGERLRAAVEAHSVEHEAQTVRFTISAGVAELRESDALDDVIGRADLALYEAKDGGRNRVVAATPVREAAASDR
jgi:diguanylate cyclase (GGDEF)-like protein